MFASHCRVTSMAGAPKGNTRPNKNMVVRMFKTRNERDFSFSPILRSTLNTIRITPLRGQLLNQEYSSPRLNGTTRAFNGAGRRQPSSPLRRAQGYAGPG